jgi:glycosyltransferase involved in cell wall biosynthesis
MKIGLIIYGSLETMSGGYLYDRQAVSYLRSRGDDVQVVSLRSGSYAHHLTDNLRVRLPHNFDLVIEDELVHASLLAANALHHGSRFQKLYPVISLVHNLHSSEHRPAWQNALYREIERLHLRSVDGFIFNSSITHASVHALVGDDRPYVIATPGGDRLGSLTADQVQARAFEPGPLRLLFLANVIPLKGLHVVLDALSRLPPGACVLDVIGSLGVEPAYARDMQKRAASLSQPVAFHGTLDHQELAKRIEQAQVLVLPSFYEGFGIAYLEAMAFGQPVIGTFAGAIPQLVTNGENGYLIAPGDASALAQRIQQLAADRALLSRLSEGALRHFQAQPTWRQSMEVIRDFLLMMSNLAQADS